MLAHARAEAHFMRERGLRLAVTGFTLTTLLSTRMAGIPLAASHAGSFVPPVFEAGLLPRMAHGTPAEVAYYCEGFNRAAQVLKVEGVPSLAALLLGDLNLVTDLPEILGISRETMERWQPPPGNGYRAGTTLRYTGPLYARWDVPVPSRVERFLEDGTVAYVALTSTPAAMVRTVVEGVGRCGVKVLVAGTVHALRDLESASVMVEPLLPSHRIMARVAIAVTTGGQGSVQSAIAAGVPLVGIALQPEQELNLRVIAGHGMAVRLAPTQVNTDAVTQAVRSVLDSPCYRESAARLQALVAGVDGARGAATAILGFLDARWATRPAPALQPEVRP
jgi:UDP:flavonoid glycosyltransferase YjiC (YdhE family)